MSPVSPYRCDDKRHEAERVICERERAVEIRRIRTLAGPNVFNHKPVLMMELALKELNIESRDGPGFNQRLQALLPGLSEHGCSLGRPGGFIERLERGTYFGHIVEH